MNIALEIPDLEDFQINYCEMCQGFSGEDLSEEQLKERWEHLNKAHQFATNSMMLSRELPC